jgi:glycosyltransferase involved in cell wall biosynthesis
MRISVIIPHLNQPAMLARCLSSIASGSLTPDEILVVDNGSDVLPQDVCSAFANVRLLEEATPGPGPARNTGVAASHGEVLAFIDADCIADPGWLAAAAAEMADPSATILGGDVRIALSDPKRLTVLEAYESIYAYRMDRYIAREGFTGTGNLVIRRSVFHDVGPFAGLSVAEDRDWGQRATRLGYRIRYVTQMRVLHPARVDFTGLFQKWDRQTAHDFTSAKMKRGGRLKFAVKTLAMGFSPLAEIPRVLASDRVSGLRNRASAWFGLIRIRLYRTRVMLWLLFGGDPTRLSGAWNRGQGGQL